MNAIIEERRAQSRASGRGVGELPRIGSRFDPLKLRGKNAARWAEFQRRQDGKPTHLQLWEA